MGYRLGLDFGTTYSKIAYVDGDGHLKTFAYPGPQGKTYVPTAVAYRKLGSKETVSIGEEARSDVLNDSNIEFCENFKMLLPLSEPSQWHEHGWNVSKSPSEVTRDYLRTLLLEGEYSFTRQIGTIDGLVVSVPEVWQRTAGNMGATNLSRIVKKDLNLPLDHLRSEPVCAAAYFAYEYQRTEEQDFSGNLLVCDMGGGTFDVALCRVSEKTIEVISFDGNGKDELGLAGVTFDRTAVELAYADEHGQVPPSGADADFTELLRAFEDRKVAKHNNVVNILDTFEKDDLYGQVIYEFRRGYRLKYEQLETAFEAIGEGINEVLSRVTAAAREQNIGIDRVAIAGGFGQFPLVRRTILQQLDIGWTTGERLRAVAGGIRFDPGMLPGNAGAYAIVYGAALIANHIMRAVEYYPHSVGIIAAREGGAYLEPDFVAIIEAGEVEAGQPVPRFLEGLNKDGYGAVPVKIKPRADNQLPVHLKIDGKGEPKPIKTVARPTPGDYYVGIQIDNSNLASLVLKPLSNDEEIWYSLGDLSIDVIVTA